MTFCFCRFFFSAKGCGAERCLWQRKRSEARANQRENKRAMGNTIVLFLSFSFWATFSPLYKEKKSQKKKPYSPLNRLSSASAIRLSAFVGARVPARTWASTESRAAETASS